MKMILTQALVLEIRGVGSESQFSKLTGRVRARLSSLEHNGNRENMFVAECL
jgi:hypothetical protein